MEEKDIKGMNIEELREALQGTLAQLREREGDVNELSQKLDKVSKEKEQYSSWWHDEQQVTKNLTQKLDALKAIVVAM